MLNPVFLNVISYSSLTPSEDRCYISNQHLATDKGYPRKKRIVDSLLEMELDNVDSMLKVLVGNVSIIYTSTLPNIKPSDTIKGYSQSLPNYNAHFLFKEFYSLDYNFSINKIYSIYGSCAGSIQALELAGMLLNQNMCDYTIIVSVDSLDADLVSLFHKMRTLSKNECDPFSTKNTGFFMAENGILMIVGRDNSDPMNLEIGNIFRIQYIDSVVSSDFVMPDPESIYRVTSNLVNMTYPGSLIGILSHGTATRSCNENEYKGLCRVYEDPTLTSFLENTKTYAIKKYIGHTLASSGLLEVSDFYGAWLEQDSQSVSVYNEEDAHLYNNPDRIRLAKDTDDFSEGSCVIKLAYGMGGLTYGMLVQFPTFPD